MGNGRQMKHKRTLLMSVLLVLSMGPPLAHAQEDQVAESQTASHVTSLAPLIEAAYPDLDALYKDLHRNPELAFQETRTAGVLAQKMKALGFEVTEKVGQTGVVAVLKNGEGPTIMVRADMDALPMTEKTGLPYASEVTDAPWRDGVSPVMHACGHDIHMASWVGAADMLVQLKDRWSGTLVFVGQPAEEGLGGAKAMIKDGLFTKFPKPDYGFALHAAPLPAGTVFVKAGAVTSSADSVEIVFKGRGAHGSMPHQSIDPIVIASRFVTDVQAVASREKDPGAFGVVTVGAFNAGTVSNIIPDQATVKLTLRSHQPEVRKLLLDGVTRTANAAAAASSAPDPDIKNVGGVATVLNDDGLAERTAAVFKEAFGPAFTYVPAMAPAGPASEDYSEFVTAGVPSVYFALGALDPKLFAEAQAGGPPVPVNHSPFFAPQPEPTIKAGVKAMTLAVLGELESTPLP